LFFHALEQLEHGDLLGQQLKLRQPPHRFIFGSIDFGIVLPFQEYYDLLS